MSNEDRQLLGPTSQRILRGDKDWANPSLATFVGVDPPIPSKDRVQGVPDGRSFLSDADSRPAALEEEVRRGDETKQRGDQMNSRIELTKAPSTRAKCKLCHKDIQPGATCVKMLDIPVSPHLVKLFFHYGCFFDAVAEAEKGVKKTVVPK